MFDTIMLKKRIYIHDVGDVTLDVTYKLDDKITKPKYKHDCDSCVFIGQVILLPKQFFPQLKTCKWDTYICNDSLIMRYADEGHEYLSMDVSGILTLPNINTLKAGLALYINKFFKLNQKKNILSILNDKIKSKMC